MVLWLGKNAYIEIINGDRCIFNKGLLHIKNFVCNSYKNCIFCKNYT